MVLSNRDLTVDQVYDGIVDGSNDCGIDGFWIFHDGRYVSVDHEASSSKLKPEIDIVIVQAKTSAGFSEGALEKLLVHLPHLLRFEHATSLPEESVNAKLAVRSERFTHLLDALAIHFPKVHIRVVYATRSATKQHPNVTAKGTLLKNRLREGLNDLRVDVEFLGAADLRRLAAQSETSSLPLRVTGTPISTERSNAYVCFVRLEDYYRFLASDTNELRQKLFESNVRDYAGATEVNSAIADTLANSEGDDFWCFNNGVTIIAEEVSYFQHRVMLRNPQIVNGPGFERLHCTRNLEKASRTPPGGRGSRFDVQGR